MKPQRSAPIAPQDAGEILITGCSAGIGRALALELLTRGYRVLATARRVESLAELHERGAAVAPLDVTVPASIAALGLAQRDIGILINNAGYGAMGALVEVSSEELERQFATNVVGPLALVRAVAPAMIRARRGRIVDVSSVSGVLTTPFAGAYCASKAALNAADEALRMELAPFGVYVITLQPGAIKSDFGASASASIARGAAGGERFYAALDDAIAARAVLQQKGAIPAAEFATLAVEAILARHPEPVVRIGPKSHLLPALKQWLPVRVREKLLARMSKLDRLRN